MTLDAYRKKRNFRRTPEPSGDAGRRGKPSPRFVVQLHGATKRHYDFRLEIDGSLKSWAIPKGPSLDPFERRLAVHVEDHPLDYGDFEGVIPAGNYGAGTVMIWDQGEILTDADALRAGYAKGDLKFAIKGERLNGNFALVRMQDGDAWLLMKKRDRYATHAEVTARDTSVVSRRSMAEIAATAVAEGKVWFSKPAVGTGRARLPAGGSPRPPRLSLAKALARTPRAALRRGKLSRWRQAGRTPPTATLLAPIYDGYRVQVLLPGAGEAVELIGQSGTPLSRRFPELIGALSRVRHALLLDAMVVPLGSDSEPRRRGVPESSRPRRRGVPVNSATAAAHVLVIYDVLHVNGRDVSQLPLMRRLGVLAALRLPPQWARIAELRHADELPASAVAMLARDPDSGEAWRLQPDAANLAAHRRAVAAAVTADSATAANDTGDSHAVVRMSGAGRPPRVPRLSKLDKIFWPESGHSKGDLIHYYRTVAPLMVPHLRDRPQSLHRHPDGIDGESFFQKEMAGHGPAWLRTATIASGRSGKVITYALVQDEASLLYLVNLGCIEINAWISRVPTINTPDYCVIDLDPGAVPFTAVVEAALEVRRVLDSVGAPAFIKTSGARGLHIFVPLAPNASFEASRTFAEKVCRSVHARLPATTSLERSPAARPRRIYLDYLQNRIGATMAQIYSVRPRPLATVSVPLRWSEVKAGLDPSVFTMQSVPRRLERVGDLWQDYLRQRIDLAICDAALSNVAVSRPRTRR